MKRREFVKLGGAGLWLAGFDPWTAFAFPTESLSSAFAEQLANTEFPFPYDAAVFEAAERISNVRRSPVDPSVWVTDLNLLLKTEITPDIKVLVAPRREDLATTSNVQSFTGVKDSMDLQILGYDSPRLYYQVQYRIGHGAWSALPPRNFKLPNAKLQDGGQINAFFVADDHNYDDGDAAVPAEQAQTKITGDYFHDFMAGLRNKPNWQPPEPLNRFHNSFHLIMGLYRILAFENPDFLVNLGDSNGIGASYRWRSWGLPYNNLKDKDYDYIARVLWMRARKTFSAVTPNMPVYWALGNHDGDEKWTGARYKAQIYRQKLFPFPTQATYPEGGHPDGNYYAFTWGADERNRGGAQFIVLDVNGFHPRFREPKKIEEWTLGAEQLKWFEDVLRRGDSEWTFACYHHPVGGWPAGSDESNTAIAYGRGPLFTKEDYASYADPAKVEQVKLTELGQRHGVRAFIYGHDHIFHAKRIGTGANGRDLYGVCAGSTKYFGEQNWWNMPLWMKHYGNGAKTNPDFFGPSGITRLSIQSDQAQFDYICTRPTPYSNLPSGGVVGAVYSSLVMTNPAPVIQIDKTELSFEMGECDEALPLPQAVKIRNAGGQGLDFKATADRGWISPNPASGSSWKTAAEVAVSLSPADFTPGKRTGTILVASSRAAVPARVSVQFLIKASPLDAPLDFEGTRIGRATEDTDRIFLTWRENPNSANVQGYRLTLVDDKGQKNFVAALDAASFNFVFLGARRDMPHRFALTAVNIRGRESNPAETVVPKFP